MAAPQVVQPCPVCLTKYDVGIYVSGQKVRCRKCGNKFGVVRQDGPSHIGRGAPMAPKQYPQTPGAQGAGRAPRATVHDKAPGRRREPDKDLPRGTNLSGYVIEDVLGKGAMGTVYKARQVALERPVAVKVMASDLVGQDEFIRRFRREAAALAQLAHPNVVSIIDRGNLDQYYYFVMEFIDGPTLRRELAQRSVGPDHLERAFDYAVQIGRGLMLAHSKSVVHRDLKPENVLLADDGAGGRICKICDFGLADLLNSNRSFVNLTGSRISMGTVNYMAPEQRHDAGGCDQRADIFSYGVIIYELLTGILPVGRYHMPSEKDSRVDPRVDHILSRALQNDRRERFKSVREMLEALVNVLSSRANHAQARAL
ncbi:MAG: protein kinase [Deltaproteobacteria bacterium]|nr:protein kinase [Deltaproteobacteria bacterium]